MLVSPGSVVVLVVAARLCCLELSRVLVGAITRDARSNAAFTLAKAACERWFDSLFSHCCLVHACADGKRGTVSRMIVKEVGGITLTSFEHVIPDIIKRKRRKRRCKNRNMAF